MTNETTATEAPEVVWRRVERAAGIAPRILLYGPPGTGKSYLARNAGRPEHVYPVILTPDTPAAEIRGHYVPTETGGFRWADGPGIAAWRTGGRLVLDEIHRAADDAYAFLLALLDDVETAEMTLATTGETLRPTEGFQVFATSNDPPDMLPEALQDRFPVTVEVHGVHPDAVAALPDDLQRMAVDLGAHPNPERRIGLRAIKEYGRLRPVLGEEDAATLVFGARSADILDALRVASAPSPDPEPSPAPENETAFVELHAAAVDNGYCDPCAKDFARTGGDNYGAQCSAAGCPNMNPAFAGLNADDDEADPTPDELRAAAVDNGYCGPCADDFARTGGEDYGESCSEPGCPNIAPEYDEADEYEDPEFPSSYATCVSRGHDRGLYREARDRGYCGPCANDHARLMGGGYGMPCGTEGCPNQETDATREDENR